MLNLNKKCMLLLETRKHIINQQRESNTQNNLCIEKNRGILWGRKTTEAKLRQMWGENLTRGKIEANLRRKIYPRQVWGRKITRGIRLVCLICSYGPGLVRNHKSWIPARTFLSGSDWNSMRARIKWRTLFTPESRYASDINWKAKFHYFLRRWSVMNRTSLLGINYHITIYTPPQWDCCHLELLHTQIILWLVKFRNENRVKNL